MKRPQRPPDPDKILEEIAKIPSKIERCFGYISQRPHTKKYYHWDKLRHHEPPKSMSHEEWWLALKLQRRNLYRKIPLRDKANNPFLVIVEIDPIPERLHEIDLGAGGQIQMPEQITNPETRDQYYISSLIQESITSSQLEGAATTRQIAKEMIKSGRRPMDRSEQMILNNFRTMQRIQEFKEKDLSTDLIFKIHRLVTEKTLDDPTAAGRFRKPTEKIVVGDMYNEILHEPPTADQLPKRMEMMCAFANRQTESGFIHPVIRSILLHFWLAYDHPFVDGNGRTARALFYWSMLRHKYWLFEFISISQAILDAPAQYEKAFLYTETDENDLTYFVLYHLDIIQKAISQLHQYIQRKTSRLHELEKELRAMTEFNYRQRSLLSHALRHPNHLYTIQSHRLSHDISYQTARTDLIELELKKLLKSRKTGKKISYTPVANIEEKLSETK